MDERKRERLIDKYFNSKAELDELRDNMTLKKWKILSAAYKTGKEIWGARFTRERLAHDMDIPITTTLRCLSLDKANKKQWELVSEGKLSAFKLAMICQSKNITYQDEIAEIVVKDNLSTYQLKTLKINNLLDINKERHRLAVEKGYSRRNSAYSNFDKWIERGKLFLMMDREYLPENKVDEVRERLSELNKNIGLYLGN